jgi:hypothetical protein
MIEIADLEKYFPEANKEIFLDKYTFLIRLYKDKKDYFSIEVDVEQKDTKEKTRFVQFLLGLGKDESKGKSCHDGEKPHFKIDYYQREEETFQATIYFTFCNINEYEMMDYANGTIVIIARILRKYFENEEIDMVELKKIIFEEAILEEIGEFESRIIDAFYQCFQGGDLIVRQKGKEPLIIKTKHNLQKYLNKDYLQPIYLPLLEKIDEG